MSSFRVLLVWFCATAAAVGMSRGSTDTNAQCKTNPIGIQDRSAIPDISLTASSYYRDKDQGLKSVYKPSNGRLEGGRGWSPRDNNNPRDYLQVDFGMEREVCAVATQGNGHTLPEWVTKYKLQFSNDNLTWITYSEGSGQNKTVFTGNSDRSTVVTLYLMNAQTARYIRFIPTGYNGGKTIRVEIYASYKLFIANLATVSFKTLLQFSWTAIEGASYLFEFVNQNTTQTTNHTRSNYTIENLQPYTEYRVRVKAIPTGLRELRSMWYIVKTSMAAPSCSPEIISVQTLNSTSVQVSWSPLPSGCRINGIVRGYRVLYSTTQNLDKKHTVNISDPSVTEVVTELRKNTEYRFQVLAYTVEDGPWSNASLGRTAEDAPECSPVIRNVQTTSSTSIRVTWAIPQDTSTCLNGILRGYKIVYSLSGADTLVYNNVYNASFSSKTVSGLRPYTKYSIRILAYTVDDGPLSNATIGTTAEDAPTCFPKLMSVQATSSSSIRVTWVPPPNTNCRNGILRGYRITYMFLSKPGGVMGDKDINNPNATTTDVTGLDVYTSYRFYVLAYTISDGPLSNQLMTRTNETAPSCSPKLDKLEAISSTSIKIYWTVQTQDDCWNGIVRGYKINYTKVGEEKSQQFDVKNGSITTCVIHGLSKYTWYEFQVLAYTVDDGPPNKRESISTYADAPSAPVNVKHLLIAAHDLIGPRVRITWDKPREENGVINKYILVYCYNTDRSTEKTITINNTITSNTYTVDVLGETSFSYNITAYTIKQGPYARGSLLISAYPPSVAPTNTTAEQFNKTTYIVYWRPAPQKTTNGKVTKYEIQWIIERRGRMRRASRSAKVNSNNAFTQELQYTVHGLLQCAQYGISVRAYTSAGPGPYSEPPVTITTSRYGEPRHLMAENAGTTKVFVSWEKPFYALDQIDYYTIEYKGFKIYWQNFTTHGNKTVPGDKTRTSIDGLVPATHYEFWVFATSACGKSPRSNSTTSRTNTTNPSVAPTDISAVKINATIFTITWRPAPRMMINGNVTKYEIRWSLMHRRQTRRSARSAKVNSNNAFTQELQYTVHGLLLCAQYGISVRAYTSAGPGPYSEPPVTITTSRHGKPQHLMVETMGTTNTLISWEKPLNILDEIIKSYTIEYKGTKSYWRGFTTQGNTTISGDTTEILIGGLLPATQYEFWVFGTSVCGKSPRSKSITTVTLTANPKAPKVSKIQEYNITDVKVNISLWLALQINGPISGYQLVVHALQKNSIDKLLPSNYTKALYNHSKAAANKLDYYVTAQVPADWSFKILTIGDGVMYGNTYKNVALEKGWKYKIYQLTMAYDKEVLLTSKEILVARISVAANGQKFSRAEVASSSGGVIGGLVTFFLLLAFAIVLVVIVWRRRRIKQECKIHAQNMSINLAETQSRACRAVNQAVSRYPTKDDQSTAISVTNFPRFIAATRKDNFFKLIEHYKMARSRQNYPCTAAMKPENKVKNRYGNIVTYDHSYVELQCLDGDENSSYINASFMHNYDGTPRTYIAAQGPLINTIDDFWRMIWEQNTQSIVMLTNLVELGKKKCDQYWPDKSGQYADIAVTNHKTEMFADYVIRTIIISKGTSESRRLLLFHFTAWPDRGVPQHATAVLSFRRKLRAAMAESGPVVIHCSAGVGRTGTFMIIDAMLEQAKYDQIIDIPNYLKIIRGDRPYMVQTSEQYVFIYLALLEELTCGNTEIEVHNLRIALNTLTAIDENHNFSGYALQFQRLKSVTSQKTPGECDTDGHEKENAKKNRHSDIAPLNGRRVVLSTDESNQRDYINATFIDTYREHNAFIVTQAPMENTVEDFWRMVMDYKIGTIVMLNNLQEGNECYTQYWPHKGDIDVEVVSLEDFGQIIARKLQVTHQSVQRVVEHFQLTCWEDKTVPNQSKPVLDLLEKVRKSQQKCDGSPVVVQCSDGVGRGGTFCAIASSLERVKQEQVLDVFQAVKCIRLNRPRAVETLSQYVFCHNIFQDYLDSFSDYANFNEQV